MLDDTFRMKLSLFLLRYSVALVFFMWTIDKFLRPDHAAAVFAHFYFLKEVAPFLMKTIGAAELLLIFAFLFGWRPGFSYGAVMILHGISTFSSFRQFLDPFSGTNLLFFASWPMFAAAVSLFLLRKEDTLFTLSKAWRD